MQNIQIFYGAPVMFVVTCFFLQKLLMTAQGVFGVSRDHILKFLQILSEFK